MREKRSAATPPSAPELLPVLTGATATGKTALALVAAEALGAEIVSMDSMTIYRRMDVGTAKPSAAERARVRHHLIDVVDPSEDFDVQRWCAAADAAVAEIRGRDRVPLFVGGTPLYLMAYFKGLLASPPADASLRAALEAREAAEPGCLHQELQRRDPESADRIHRNDRRRLVRALEVLQLTGVPISAQQTDWEARGWRRPCRIVALHRPREELRARIRARTMGMLTEGLLAEVAAIRDSGGFSRQAAGAIGYAECLAFLAGRLKDEEELRNRIRRATHRLVRKQTTWLRRLTEVRWLDADADAGELLATLRG
ncbi:MAG: tRNA (adenosine(37)-N6)-dimethylallyltransferase MiaA [Planctomycetota bacterium]